MIIIFNRKADESNVGNNQLDEMEKTMDKMKKECKEMEDDMEKMKVEVEKWRDEMDRVELENESLVAQNVK